MRLTGLSLTKLSFSCAMAILNVILGSKGLKLIRLSTKDNGCYQNSYTLGAIGSAPASLEYGRAGATDPVAVPVIRVPGAKPFAKF